MNKSCSAQLESTLSSSFHSLVSHAPQGLKAFWVTGLTLTLTKSHPSTLPTFSPSLPVLSPIPAPSYHPTCREGLTQGNRHRRRLLWLLDPQNMAAVHSPADWRWPTQAAENTRLRDPFRWGLLQSVGSQHRQCTFGEGSASSRWTDGSLTCLGLQVSGYAEHSHQN